MKVFKKIMIPMSILMTGLIIIITACQEKQNDTDYLTGSCFGHLVGGIGEISTLKDLGSMWVRPHPGPFTWQWVEPTNDEFDWSLTDKWVIAAQESDISILGTIWPYADWDQATCHPSSSQVSSSDHFYPGEAAEKNLYIPKYRCIPCDFDDYKDFLFQLIERYDGDGEKDMDGLTQPIKYWEILNEPEMVSENLTFFIGSQEEYVQILQASYETIKTACPDCQVLNGGAAGMENESLSYWEGIFDLGGGNYFDILNIHFLGGGDPNTLNVSGFKDLLERKGLTKQIWGTESLFPSENDMVSFVKGALDAGASKVFALGYMSFLGILESEPTICN